MIIKILIHGQEDLGKFYTALGSSDNSPRLAEGKLLFDGSLKPMAKLVHDIKQKTEIDGEWEYTLTLNVAEFIGEHSSDGLNGPEWDTLEPVPGEWILKIFNAIGRYPFDAKMPAEEHFMVLSRHEVSELLNLDKRMVVDVMFWLERIYSIDPKDDSEVALDHKRHFTERGEALIRLITGESGPLGHLVALIEKAIDTHLTVDGERP